jgi:hypothetical protein
MEKKMDPADLSAQELLTRIRELRNEILKTEKTENLSLLFLDLFDLEIAFSATAEGKARKKLSDSLRELMIEKQINQSEICLQLLAVFDEMITTGSWAKNAQELFEPIEMGRTRMLSKIRTDARHKGTRQKKQEFLNCHARSRAPRMMEDT